MGFYYHKDGKYSNKQEAVWRTSCMDCLDRTNYAQARISTLMLHKILSEIAKGYQNLTIPVENAFQLNKEEDILIQAHKKLWSGNGNSLSQYYTSSDSGLTQVVERGKQGFGGKISKMFTGVKRYFANG